MKWSEKGFLGGKTSMCAKDGGNNDYLKMETSCTAAQEQIAGGEL